ncbi:hypothetical protein C5167_018646 [Papaver somniferum]|uniref:Uncharacterized protein n=1 Tax=Papaver somniferum TaxID=3469 RepID=A0A4Y7IQZ5_PAPSO|nr:hypothetical protein C5167_018646 [Papaver somniferum]
MNKDFTLPCSISSVFDLGNFSQTTIKQVDQLRDFLPTTILREDVTPRLQGSDFASFYTLASLARLE